MEDYYKQLVGTTITDFRFDITDNNEWPMFTLRKPDGITFTMILSRDPEGNGSGYSFITEKPPDYKTATKTSNKVSKTSVKKQPIRRKESFKYILVCTACDKVYRKYKRYVDMSKTKYVCTCQNDKKPKSKTLILKSL